MGRQPARPRPPEDLEPRRYPADMVPDQDNQVRFQLLATDSKALGEAFGLRAYVVLRTNDTDVWLSVHQKSTLDPLMVPRLIQRHRPKDTP